MKNNGKLVGHADNLERNGTALSLKRAESVKTYLIKNGIASSILVVEGYGNQRPIATHSTAEGRAENRRVEFHVDGYAPKCPPGMICD